MTKTQQYEVDFINSKIVLTKKFYKAATILNTPEYTALIQIRRENPDFTIELREIKKKEGKKSYYEMDRFSEVGTKHVSELNGIIEGMKKNGTEG